MSSFSQPSAHLHARRKLARAYEGMGRNLDAIEQCRVLIEERGYELSHLDLAPCTANWATN